MEEIKHNELISKKHKKTCRNLNYLSQLSRKTGKRIINSFLGKDKLNTIDVLISKALIDSYIGHNKFVSVNNLLRKYNEKKEEIKNPEKAVEYTIQIWLI